VTEPRTRTQVDGLGAAPVLIALAAFTLALVSYFS
jgi:hypothetical protein